MTYDEIIEDVRKKGYAAGVAAGSWVVDGNTPEATARRILEGIEAGDPEIMDALPSSPLSGEWADSLLPRDVLGWYDRTEADDNADSILEWFEIAYGDGVLDEVTRACRAILGEES